MPDYTYKGKIERIEGEWARVSLKKDERFWVWTVRYSHLPPMEEGGTFDLEISQIGDFAHRVFTKTRLPHDLADYTGSARSVSDVAKRGPLTRWHD